MFSGHFLHKNIIESSLLKHELSAGWIFHYLIGASVALTYPFFYLASDVPMLRIPLIMNACSEDREREIR